MGTSGTPRSWARSLQAVSYPAHGRLFIGDRIPHIGCDNQRPPFFSYMAGNGHILLCAAAGGHPASARRQLHIG